MATEPRPDCTLGGSRTSLLLLSTLPLGLVLELLMVTTLMSCSFLGHAESGELTADRGVCGSDLWVC